MATVPVILRRFRDDGDTIALFPTIPADSFGRYCESYQHIGQHGAADLDGCIRVSDPIPESDPAAARMISELRRVGYTREEGAELRVVKRAIRAMVAARLASIRP